MRSDDEEVSHHGRFTTDGANNVVYPDKYNLVDKTKKTFDVNGKAIFTKEGESDHHRHMNLVTTIFINVPKYHHNQLITRH